MRPLVALLVVAAPVLAQSDRFLSAGVIAGADFRQTLVSTTVPQPVGCFSCLVEYSVPARKPFSFGGAVEVRLTRRVAVEADGMYRRISYSSVFYWARPTSGVMLVYSKTTASRWEVPLLAKYRFGRAFLAVGGALGGIAGVFTEADSNGFQHTRYDDSGQITKGPRAGVVAGGGVEWRAGPVVIAPQLRATRWVGAQFIAEPGLRSNQWEAGAFLGLMF